MTLLENMARHEREYMARRFPRTYARDLSRLEENVRLKAEALAARRRPSFERERHMEITIKRLRMINKPAVEMPTVAVALAERRITARQIIAATAAASNLPPSALIGPRRTQDRVKARQIAMFLIRKHTHRSYPQIGNDLGGRDHTTIIHGRGKVLKSKEMQDIAGLIERELRL